MSQCEKCIHENAPCFTSARESAEKNACGCYENAQPWLEKWIVPDEYEILAETPDRYYGRRKIDNISIGWCKKTGDHDLSDAQSLIPKRPALKEGDPVIVWEDEKDKRKGCFAKRDKDGRIRTFSIGTKWESNGVTTAWTHYRIPTAKEIETGVIE